MRRILPATIILMLLIGLLIPYCSAQEGERVKLILDLEPRGCGEVYAEPPGENYTYAPGTMVQVYARPAEGCRFAYWASDLAGLNGSISNPVTLTLFSDTYLKAVFARIGAPRPGAGEGAKHVFLRITANVTGFQEEVRLVPAGEEVTITVPREIFVNDSARYVFVGWDGLDSKEPTITIRVTEDTAVKALYTLYLKFMDLWYHYTDFTEFHAPVVELGPGARMRPTHLLLRPVNITLPAGSRIPRELADRVEVKYQKEYLLTVGSTISEPLVISLNGEPITLESTVQRWVPEGAAVTLTILWEPERAWVAGPTQRSLMMDGPKSILIEFEEKPHAWALDSPLKPLIYPILDSVAARLRGGPLWPQASRIISQPILVYAIFAAVPAAVGGIGYMGYRILSRITVGAGRGRKVIEERIRRAEPEEIISAIPSGTATMATGMRREEELPESAPFPEWLHVEPQGGVEPISMATRPVEEPTWPAGEPEEAEGPKMDPLQLISAGGEVLAGDLVEAMAGRLDEEVFNALRDAVLSGRLTIECLDGEVWSPLWVRRVAVVLEREGAAAIIGADIFVRERVARWLGLVEKAATGGSYKLLENAYERDVEGAAARIGGASLVILGEMVGPETVMVYRYAAGLLRCRLVKLGEGPLPPARIQYPSVEELAAYMAVKAAAMDLIDRVGLDEVMEVADIASMSRSYTTIDDYLKMLATGPISLGEFKRLESSRLFDRFEQEAVAVWRRTGRINDAIIHYSNILVQMDPANAEVKLRIFREKLVKIVERLQQQLQQLRGREPARQPPAQQAPAKSPPEEAVKPELKPEPAPGKEKRENRELDEIARRYEIMLRGVGSDEVRKRLEKQLRGLRGEHREE
jgi:hypothetical protein